MKNQPDFQKLFFEYFGSTPKRVGYQVRQDSNCQHDLVFLSSLVHDARFKKSDFVLKGKHLTISINRDCWEPGIVEKKGEGELHVADSRLSITNVVSANWSFQHGFMTGGSNEMWINDLWLDPNPNKDSRRLTIHGHGWHCELRLAPDNFQIKLTDKEVPYLYSQRKKKKANV